MLSLERPIVFADFETTGTSTETDRIIEYAFCKLYPDGSRETKTGRLNPEIPIPAGATLIHGIKDEDVKGKPTFRQFAKGILAFIDGCDLGGFASNHFDFPLLYAEFTRAGINWKYSEINMIDVGVIYKIKEARTLAAAYQFYCGKELEGAHGAEADILATAECFEAQLRLYEDLPTTIEELAIYSNYGRKILDLCGGLFTYAEDGKTILFAKGKNKDKPATDYDYLSWVYYKSTFPVDTKELAKKLMDAIPYK